MQIHTSTHTSPGGADSINDATIELLDVIVVEMDSVAA